MKKEPNRNQRLVGLSMIFLILTAGITGGMYLYTGYVPYFYLCMTDSFLCATNLLFLLRKIIVRHGAIRAKNITEEKRMLRFLHKIRRGFPKVAWCLSVAGYVLLFLFGNRIVWNVLQAEVKETVPEAFHIAVFLTLFVGTLILEKLCEYRKETSPFLEAILENGRSFFRILSVLSFVACILVIVESLGLVMLQRYAGYVFAAAFWYCVVCVLLSLAVLVIRKEFEASPYLNIPLWGLKGRKTVGLLTYLEQNTGISMRSLWSVTYIRSIAPIALVLIAAGLWLSTGVVQIEPYQQAAVYRFGVLQDEMLQDGIHLILPYPFEKAVIYDTEALNKMTIGFRSEESADNLWTSSHQGEEYKLLLGSSDEVVSINLRLEYKISDLRRYLESSAHPEDILRALSYELVTEQTIHTDLNTLLSVDREAFSQEFQRILGERLADKQIGLSVVSVVLESIHPPKEIADIYQKTISAEIDAETKIHEAERMASVILAEAKVAKNESISLAEQDSISSVSEAKAGVAEFLASVEADRTYGDGYTYQKYLHAVREAYGKANLVIVSEDVDQSAIFFGNFGNSDEESDAKQ